VGHDGHACPAVRPARGAEDPLLGRRDVVALRADLADEARPYTGLADAVEELGHEAVRELVGQLLADVLWIDALAIPARAHDDVHARALADAPQRGGITRQPDVRRIADRPSAGRLVAGDLANGELLVVEDRLV